jgi:hypothetical protein
MHSSLVQGPLCISRTCKAVMMQRPALLHLAIHHHTRRHKVLLARRNPILRRLVQTQMHHSSSQFACQCSRAWMGRCHIWPHSLSMQARMRLQDRLLNAFLCIMRRHKCISHTQTSGHLLGMAVMQCSMSIAPSLLLCNPRSPANIHSSRSNKRKIGSRSGSGSNNRVKCHNTQRQHSSLMAQRAVRASLLLLRQRSHHGGSTAVRTRV